MKPQLTLKTRREFLRTTVLGSALSWTVPTFLAKTFASLHAQAADKATQVLTGRDGSILVVLQLAGGNDGLNTVVPFADDFYHKARPRLAIAGKNVLKLNDSLGLHPALKGLKALYDAGHLAVVQGVGYPNPNRSHFRSTEIWQTASDANRFESTGWLGRYFDNTCAGCDPAVAVAISSQMPQAFAAKNPKGICFTNPEAYRLVKADRPGPGEMDMAEESLRRLNEPDETPSANAGGSIAMLPGAVAHAGAPLDFIERTALDAQISSDQLRAIAAKGENRATYPPSQLANSLKLVARLIAGGMPTRIYYVSQGGYDTHTNQAGTHERLLTELGDALQAFVDDLKAQGHFERVLLMTFSEFGRRLAENASGGTDHGAAAPLLILGGRVKAGLLGKAPSLAPADLFNGDPKFTVDFRSVYAGVLEHWLKTPSAPVLGRPFPPLQIV
ncbi:MAG: DUF1501 domain-containing protein [Verrucomicrobiae bacterium]|nr:DUF1501 domain-containing protein [Verrucomicrobiae bacterium]